MDTSLQRTITMVPQVSGICRFHCILCQISIFFAKKIMATTRILLRASVIRVFAYKMLFEFCFDPQLNEISARFSKAPKFSNQVPIYQSIQKYPTMITIFTDYRIACETKDETKKVGFVEIGIKHKMACYITQSATSIC